MAFNVTKTDGSTLVIVSSNTVDTTTTSIALHGRGKLEWGNEVNKNFVHMLENFAFSISPSNPLVGQLWFDTSSPVLKVWTGSVWSAYIDETTHDLLRGNFADGSPPSAPLLGQHWYDSNDDALNYWDGSTWQQIQTTGAGGALFVNVSGDTMTGQLNMESDIQFDIPNLYLTAGSPNYGKTQGINWIGNTDAGSIYAETTYPHITSLVLEVRNNAGSDTIKLRHDSTTDGGQMRDMLVASSERTTIYGTDDAVLRISTADEIDFGFIEYFTDSSAATTATARVGFVDYVGSGTTGNESSTDFTIDNRSNVIGGVKALDYREDGVLKMRVDGSTFARQFAVAGPGLALSTDFSNAAFAIMAGGFDLVLGANDQITRGNTGGSRALVKTTGASLTINFNGDFTEVNISSNLDMENHQIKRVANGTAGTDAVNLNQLNGLSSTYSRPVETASVDLINVDMLGGTASTTGWVSKTLASVGVPSTAKAVIIDVLFESSDTNSLAELQVKSGFTGTGGIKRVAAHLSAGGGDQVATGGQAVCFVNSTGFQYNQTGDITSLGGRRIRSIVRVVGYFS